MPERFCVQCGKVPLEHWQATVCAKCASDLEQQHVADRNAHQHELKAIACLHRGEDPHSRLYDLI
jgi:hypothetical protein